MGINVDGDHDWNLSACVAMSGMPRPAALHKSQNYKE